MTSATILLILIIAAFVTALVAALTKRDPWIFAAVILLAFVELLRAIFGYAGFRLLVLLCLALSLIACAEATAAGPIATYAPDVIGVAFTALAAFVAKHLVDHVFVQGLLSRLVVEAKAVVLEVEQTYVDAIKAAKSDGVLTKDEAVTARDRALSTLKENIGAKGLARLGRILGLTSSAVDGLLVTHVEAAVGQLTLAQTAAAAAPAPAITMSTPPLSSSR